MLSNKSISTPYYAVIFTSISSGIDEGYMSTAARMLELAKNQKGFLGIESARSDIGITISYWTDLEAIKQWKNNEEHLIAQNNGKNKWYKAYTTRICKVEKEYFFNNQNNI